MSEDRRPYSTQIDDFDSAFPESDFLSLSGGMNTPKQSELTQEKVLLADPKTLKASEAIVEGAALPPLSDDDKSRLQSRIADLGAVEPIYVWANKDIVVDGLARLGIYLAQKLDLVPITYVELGSELEAIRFRLVQNLARRHLNDWQRAKAASQSVLANCPKRANGDGNKWDDIERTFKVKRKMVGHAARVLKDGPKYMVKEEYHKLIDELESGKRAPYSGFAKVTDASNNMTGSPKLSTDTKPLRAFAEKKEETPEAIEIDSINVIDCVKGLSLLPNDSVDLLFTSPPYHGISEDYGGVYNPKAEYSKFLEMMGGIAQELYRILKPGGTVVINSDNATSHTDKRDEGYRYDQNEQTYNLLNDAGFILFEKIRWFKQVAPGSKPTNGNTQSPRFRSKHETLTIVTKGKPQKKHYGNIEGMKPSDFVTSSQMQDWGVDVWDDIHPVTKGEAKKNHPFPFPEQLADRVIKIFTNPGGLVVDCFNGSGTTTAVAGKLLRHYVGIDANSDYCKYAINRTAEAIESRKAIHQNTKSKQKKKVSSSKPFLK